LEDLIATADRQLASRSYDAAIDTYRTALGEPGAAEAAVAERLEAACGARDLASVAMRGAGRPEPPRVDPEPVRPEQPRIDPEPTPVEPRIDPKPEPPAEPPPDPETPPTPMAVERPIEAPLFRLIEDDRSMLESPSRGQYPMEMEKLSILDPNPLPEEKGDPMLMVRIAVAAVIAVAVCVVVVLLK
jgi:hypothetical protein